MIESIELQMISRILTTQSDEEIDALCSFDESYYSIFKEHIKFILDHRMKYGNVPDIFTFQSQFPDVTLVQVKESISFLKAAIQENKQHIILLETFNKIKELGSADVKDAWKYIGMQYERVLSLDSTAPMDIIHQAKERADQVVKFSQQSRIPTGFDEVDKLMYGGLSTVEELVIVVARTNTGKAQPLWSRVLTPHGWTTMGQLKIGDTVIGKNNDNGRVVQLFPQGVKKYYRVRFDDNTYTECCDDHLWEVVSKQNTDKFDVLTLNEIRHSIDTEYEVAISSELEFLTPYRYPSETESYILGVLLSSNGFRRSTISLPNGTYVDYKRLLKKHGLYASDPCDRFIPRTLFGAPIHVRKALLAGLLDADGSPCNDVNQFRIDTSSEILADDILSLVRSLGVKCKLSRLQPRYTFENRRVYTSGSYYRVVGECNFNPFRYSDKFSKFKLDASMKFYKKIVAVEYAGETECQCILLDNDSHTYITDDYIVTHNSWVMTKMMESAQAHKYPCLYYSPEMQASFLGTRFDTWRKHFQNSQLFRGNYNEEYHKYIDSLQKEDTPAFILEDKDVSEGSVNVPVLESLVKRYNIKLLIVDGLSYMEDSRSRYSDKDYEKYKNLSTDLFRLSKKYGCAVVVAMQANRESKDSKDDKGEIFPTAMNIEGSDHPARIATQVFAIRQVFERHVLDIRLEKSRMANNQKPVLSYSWDINTGNIQNIQGEDSGDIATMTSVAAATPKIIKHAHDDSAILDDDDFDDVEF